MLDTYCVGCHNSRTKAGGVAFDALDLNAVHEHPDIWEAALRKLRGRQMPPPGNRQPDQREIDAFVSWMETTLDAAPRRSGEAAKAGHVPIQRLTRTEFATAVNDLLGVELDAEKLLPAEVIFSPCQSLRMRAMPSRMAAIGRSCAMPCSSSRPG